MRTPAPSMIIIGVGPGIGTAVARRFAREGFVVGMIARREDTVTTAAEALGSDVTTWTRAADATDETGLTDALRAFVGTHGAPDAVVYNAAIIRTDEPGELDQAAMLDTYAVNVVGAITTAGALLPDMARGTFVITSGMPAPDPGLTSLSLGKVGVRGLVEILTGWQDRVHVASVTVGGPVEPGSAYDPDDIAEHYWRLHTREVTDHEVRHG
jgi:NAD(P)-dependent dehydrogenase (short-subunit alcohol dehydrogenase family)